VVKENKNEIWTSAIDGSNPTFRSTGHDPRFTADGFHLIYVHADLQGNEDIWIMDLRNGATDRITDADELDITPDASRDGRWIAFASTRGVAPSIWIVAASGGKRLRINDGGFGPRFSPDSRSIVFWNKGAIWTMATDGSGIQETTLDAPPMPSIAGWLKMNPAVVMGRQIRGTQGSILYESDRPLWPRFDVMPDGRFVLAPIDIRETGLWAVDLQFRSQ
jgi:TolB protein